MKLDKRIIEGKSYLDCFDIEVAKEFIGKECYLSDGVAAFANIDNLKKATLMEVDAGGMYPYKLENIRWRYESFFILPCAWVKIEEKRYRPLTLPEFTYLIGKPLCVRAIKPRIQNIPIKHVYSIPWLTVITQVWQDIEDGEVYVQLGNAKYTNKELWNAFEYAVLDNKEWVCTPTGIVKSTVYVPFGKSTEESNDS